MKINYEETDGRNCVGLTYLTLSLDSEMCANSDLVGNKARSLFRLKKSIAHGLINDVSSHNKHTITQFLRLQVVLFYDMICYHL